jgi:ribosomal-protein-alanine N-acetyltransferase
MEVTTRLASADDGPALAAHIRANRDFLRPWEPVRPAEYFTDDGQRAVLAGMLHDWTQGRTLPHLILADGRIVGRIALTNIARGPFQSAQLGYWVAADVNGRGVATAAVAQIIRIAFGELGLHRLEAGTLVHNVASQRVLERNGFQRYGLAPRYLKIAGDWQDHVLYQVLAE